MKSRILFFILICIFSIHPTSKGQNSHWNLVIDEGYHTFLCSYLLERDSTYYLFGSTVDTIPTYEQGVSVSKISSKSAKRLSSVYYGEKDVLFTICQVNSLIHENNKIIIPLSKGNSGASVHLFSYDLDQSIYEKLKVIPSPESLSNFVFLSDFFSQGEFAYILCGIQTKDTNEPMILKINKVNWDYKYIRWKEKKDTIIQQKMAFHNGGIIVYATYHVAGFLNYGLLITFMDLDGNIIWEQKSPGVVTNNDIDHILPINDHEILISSNDFIYDYNIKNVTSRYAVMRYNTETKKPVWYTWWNEPRKENRTSESQIIKSTKSDHYFLMASDYIREDTLYYTSGKIVKFNNNGQKLWQKSYYHSSKWAVINEFINMIPTSDGNYLIGGWEGLSGNAWLVKIDEDGNILPIDTTSSIDQINITRDLPEIKIYPNPASHSIIINQGEISDMTYQLIDITGAVVKTIPLPHAHHHLVWDISEVASGTYILAMMKGTTLIGTKQVEVVK